MADAAPNTQGYANRLSNFHGKLLDGSAFIDAYTTWILLFLYACSTLVQDAWSVYDTWCGSDLTGPNDVAVPGAVITAAQQQRANRNNRLHQTLMQFTVLNSFLDDDLNTKNLLAVRDAFSMIWTTLYVSGQISPQGFVNQVAEDNIGSEDINWVQQRGRGRGRGRVRQTDGRGAKGGKGKGGVVTTIRKSDAFYLTMYKNKTLERAVNEFVTCYKCGGVGHTGVTRFTDGTLVVCATLATFPDGLPTGVLQNIVHGHLKDRQNAREAVFVDDDDVEAQYANMELGMNVEMDDAGSSSDIFNNICRA